MYIVDVLAQKNDFKTIESLTKSCKTLNEIAEPVAWQTLIVELNPSVKQLPPENLKQLVFVKHLVIRSTGLKWIRRMELPNVDMELLTRMALGIEPPQQLQPAPIQFNRFCPKLTNLKEVTIFINGDVPNVWPALKNRSGVKKVNFVLGPGPTQMFPIGTTLPPNTEIVTVNLKSAQTKLYPHLLDDLVGCLRSAPNLKRWISVPTPSFVDRSMRLIPAWVQLAPKLQNLDISDILSDPQEDWSGTEDYGDFLFDYQYQRLKGLMQVPCPAVEEVYLDTSGGHTEEDEAWTVVHSLPALKNLYLTTLNPMILATIPQQITHLKVVTPSQPTLSKSEQVNLKRVLEDVKYRDYRGFVCDDDVFTAEIQSLSNCVLKVPFR